MSFNIKPGIAGAHQSSVSGYSGNKINVDESFHIKGTVSGEAPDQRASYNIGQSIGVH